MNKDHKIHAYLFQDILLVSGELPELLKLAAFDAHGMKGGAFVGQQRAGEIIINDSPVLEDGDAVIVDDVAQAMRDANDGRVGELEANRLLDERVDGRLGHRLGILNNEHLAVLQERAREPQELDLPGGEEPAPLVVVEGDEREELGRQLGDRFVQVNPSQDVPQIIVLELAFRVQVIAHRPAKQERILTRGCRGAK